MNSSFCFGRPAALLLVTFSLTVLASAPARAQTPPAPNRTTDYVERSAGGDAIVTFVGDELAAPPGGAYGDTIRRPPGATRAGLIRPRLNFVVELVKSVENL